MKDGLTCAKVKLFAGVQQGATTLALNLSPVLTRLAERLNKKASTMAKKAEWYYMRKG